MRAGEKASSKSELQQMVDLMYRLAPHEGYTLSALEGVKFLRSNRSFGRAPIFYEPLLCFVCQGRKNGYLGAEVFAYDAHQYLALSVPLPFEADTEASAEKPLLAVAIDVNLVTLAELLPALDPLPTRESTCPQPMYTGLVDGELRNAVLRLLQALASPMDAKVLAAAIVREIHYRALVRDDGRALRCAVSQGTHFSSIAKVLRLIQADFARKLDVNALANGLGVSRATFFANFGAVTATSPHDYITAMRLHQGRLLMIRNGLNVVEAAEAVGFENGTHFGREFKRLFGRTAGEETAYMGSSLSIVPEEIEKRYVAKM